MMNNQLLAVERLIKEKKVLYLGGGHWSVKSDTQGWLDVWYKNGSWECNGMVLKNKGFVPTCAYYKGDKTKPHCKHTRAAAMTGVYNIEQK